MKLILNALVAIMIVLGFGHAAAHAANAHFNYEKKSLLDDANSFLEKTQRFLVGTIIGMTHGITNKVAESQIPENNIKIRQGLHGATFVAATYLAHTYEPVFSVQIEPKEFIRVDKNEQGNHKIIIKNARLSVINDNYKLVLLGRGVGQCITETAVDACQSGTIRPSINLSLVASLAWYSWDYISR
ncbi:MAG: hypothetical protein M1114_05740 [Candidatus Dependentiae bacterium]|nr:hypothetical protein [Candidatus Dependentiae bacterium]